MRTAIGQVYYSDMKQQVVVIHGGETFDTYEAYLEFLKAYSLDFDAMGQKMWKDTLGEKLGEEYEVIKPRMPNALNAKYAEWKIWFEKYIPNLRDGIIFVGHSLGGIFLAKYLGEHTFPRTIDATFLVAAPYDDANAEYTLADFVVPESLDLLAQQSGKLYLVHSEDDPVVAFADFRRYQAALPTATAMTFTDKGHFILEEFPELVNEIRHL